MLREAPADFRTQGKSRMESNAGSKRSLSHTFLYIDVSKSKKKEGGCRKIRTRLSKHRSGWSGYKNPVLSSQGSAEPAGGKEGAILPDDVPDETE